MQIFTPIANASETPTRSLVDHSYDLIHAHSNRNPLRDIPRLRHPDPAPLLDARSPVVDVYRSKDRPTGHQFASSEPETKVKLSVRPLHYLLSPLQPVLKRIPSLQISASRADYCEHSENGLDRVDVRQHAWGIACNIVY